MSALDMLEPEAMRVQNVNGAPQLTSIAVSLKRIADTLDGTSGISLAQTIENAIGTGMFHGFQNLKR